MRVLILSADLPPHVWSGVGTAVAQQAAALSECGCDVDVLTTAPSGFVDGVPVTRLERSSFPSHLRGRDVVHVHSLRFAKLARELRRRDGSRLVYTAHSLLEWELDAAADSLPWREEQEQLFVDADHVIFVSERERARALGRWPVLAGRASVLRNGLDRPLERMARHPACGNPPAVMFAGRFCRSKGFDVAVGAMRLLMESNASVRCVLAGGRGDEPDAMAAGLAQSFPGRCMVMGWLPQAELWQAMRRSALLLMPSRYEPFAMMALEAHAVGLPVLYSAVAGWHHPERPSPAAEMVEGFDPRAWYGKIVELLDDPARLERMSLAGPGFLQAEFDHKRLSQAYFDLLSACTAAGFVNSRSPEPVFAPRTMPACG